MRLSPGPLAIGCALALSSTAIAAPIVTSTPANQSNANASDVDYDTVPGEVGRQNADDFTLGGSGATARGVIWRGVFAAGDNVPQFPLSFNVIIYGTTGSLPNFNNVISTTAVTFASAANITDTGVLAGARHVYEFRSNLTPAVLTAGTTYWMSVLANTANDANDDFFWTRGNTNQNAALRVNLATNQTFSSSTLGPFYYVLDDAPTAAGLPGDFNNDAVVNATDIDLLCNRINAGTGPVSPFDVNGDGSVNVADVNFEVTNILDTKFGDTDTDGDVDLNDLGNLASGFGVPGEKRWSRGNFDCDNDVDLPDLGTLATNFGAGRDAAMAAFEALVPEPAIGMAVLGFLPGMLRRRH